MALDGIVRVELWKVEFLGKNLRITVFTYCCFLRIARPRPPYVVLGNRTITARRTAIWGLFQLSSCLKDSQDCDLHLE